VERAFDDQSIAQDIPLQWYRVKASYPKAAGGFLVIGPRYAGEVTEDQTAVLERSSG
jgi:hypothetical protein